MRRLPPERLIHRRSPGLPVRPWGVFPAAALLLATALMAQVTPPAPTAAPTPTAAAAPAATAPPAAAPAPAAPSTSTPVPALGAPALELDLVALLTLPDTLPTQVPDDPVWTAAPAKDQRLLQLPFILKPSDKPYQINAATVSFRGGRFLAWRIDPSAQLPAVPTMVVPPVTAAPPPAPPSPAPPAANPRTGRIAMPVDGGAPGIVVSPIARAAGVAGSAPPPAAAAPAPAEPRSRLFVIPPGPSAAAVTATSLPGDPPRLVRLLAFDPPNRLHWNLETALPGFSVRESEHPYVFKLKADLLRKHDPGRPPATVKNAGEDYKAFAARKAAVEADYSQKKAAFTELQKKVQALPTSFELAAPVRVWAILEARATMKDSAIDTPGVPGATSWPTSFKMIEGLRARCAPVGPPNDIGAVNDASARADEMLTMLTSSPHPYTFRLVAQVIALSNLAPHVQPDGGVAKLFDAILKGKDDQARRVLTGALAAVDPPTPAVAALLHQAAQSADPGTQMLALRGLLRAEGKDPARAQELLDSVNAILAAAPGSGGPAAGEVLAELLAAAKAQPALVPVLARGIKFGGLSDTQRASAIALALSQAPTEPIAAGWVDSLLRDPATVRYTLDLLAGPTEAAPAAGGGAPSLWGKALSLLGGQAAAPANPPMVPVTPVAAPAAPGALGAPAALIPIDAPRHGLLAALHSTDGAVRQQAWRALRFFVLAPIPPVPPPAPAPPGATAPPAPAAAPGDPYLVLAQAALMTQPTPVPAVEFLRRQADAPRAAAALALILVSGDKEGARAAVRALRGSTWALEPCLRALAEADRQQFGRRVYESENNLPPLVTGLLRLKPEECPAVDWFARELSAGRVPALGAWLAAAGGDDRMLEGTKSKDADVALAAVAALVNAAGGDDATVRAMAPRLREAKVQTLDYLRVEWGKMRQDVYATRLQAASGKYRIMIRLYPKGTVLPALQGQPGVPAAPATPGAAVPAPAGQVDAGVIDLVADGKTVRLANQSLTLAVADSQMAIRIAKPMEIKGLLAGDAAALPIDGVAGPLDLVPQPDSSWRCRFALPEPDGRLVELALEPAKAP